MKKVFLAVVLMILVTITGTFTINNFAEEELPSITSGEDVV